MWWTWSRGIEGHFAPFALPEACQRKIEMSSSYSPVYTPKRNTRRGGSGQISTPEC